MRRHVGRLWSNADGSVAPTVALSLFALIMAGGIAFDYARLASLDTELQQAADQAALAAATQLDGSNTAITRAKAAAANLLANRSLISSQSGDTKITVPDATITFYTSWDNTTDTGTATTDPTKAHIVEVIVAGRSVNYALTSFVGAFGSRTGSGTITAQAVAGMGSAICKEPPVMMCNPNSAPGTFNLTNFVGKGMLLIATGGSGAYAPGDFGFLDVGAGASDLSKLMGYGSPTFECVDITQPTTEPGGMTSVINEFNTRFDLYESGDSINCWSQNKCPPSINSRKDLILKTGSDPTKLNNCGIASGAGSKGWIISDTPYRPTSADVDAYSLTPDAMGYPRDKCHAWSLTGDCVARNGTPNARIGSGSWDIDAYWRVNHASSAVVIDATTGLKGYPTSMNSTIMAAAPLPAGVTRTYPSRYQVYKWEMANRATQLPASGRAVGSIGTDYGQPICRPGLSGSIPASQSADRRVLPVAVVNCTGLNGKKAVNPIDWIDVFLVEPSTGRDNGLSGPAKASVTQTGDIYVEVIGRTTQGVGGTTNQFVRRDKPYLIK